MYWPQVHTFDCMRALRPAARLRKLQEQKLQEQILLLVRSLDVSEVCATEQASGVASPSIQAGLAYTATIGNMLWPHRVALRSGLLSLSLLVTGGHAEATLYDRALGHEEWIRAARRAFHRQPELGMQEVETSKMIRARLDELGVSYECAPPAMQSALHNAGRVATGTCTHRVASVCACHHQLRPKSS